MMAPARPLPVIPLASAMDASPLDLLPPGKAEEERPPSSAGRAAGRRDRGGDRGVAVVRRDRQWAADAGPEALAVLGAARGPADESTFRRAFALISADVLDRVLGPG
jgi:hypothetical protein